MSYQYAVVAAALGPTDDAVIEQAGALATALGVRKIDLVHVAPSLDLPPDLPAAEKLLPRDEEIEHLLQALQSRGQHWPPDATFHVDVREGATVKALMKLLAQKSADLLAIGRHHLSSEGRLGPHAIRLIQRAPCTVLAVPHKPRSELRRLLVPIDFSDHSRAAVETALAIRESLNGNCEVCVQHVYDVPVGFERAGCSFQAFADSLLRHAETRWAQMDKDLNATERGATIRYDLIPIEDRSHDPASVIGRTAEELDTDMIVIGGRGLSHLASIILGSVTDGVLRTSTRPVLCVKHKGETLGLLQAVMGTDL